MSSIGIDFGTTNTIVTYSGKRIRTLEMNGAGDKVVPTAIYFKSRNSFEIGREALNNQTHPLALVTNFKTHFGNNSNGKSYPTKVIAENGETLSITPAKATTLFFSKLIKRIEDNIQRDFIEEINGDVSSVIENVIVTVPAKFKQETRDEIFNALAKAGLNVKKSMQEPVAVAVAYTHDKLNSGASNLIIYDFGGGTFDITVLKSTSDGYKNILGDGDPNLGGNDITRCLVEDTIDKINTQLYKEAKIRFDIPKKLLTLEEYNKSECKLNYEEFLAIYKTIFTKCNRIKEKLDPHMHIDLTYQEEMELHLSMTTKNIPTTYVYTCRYKMDEINNLIEPCVMRTIDITRRALERARQQNIHINKIVLSGGSSNIPLVQSKLNELAKKFNVTVSRDSDFAVLVSRGAAIQASKIFDNSTYDKLEIGYMKLKNGVYSAFNCIFSENDKIPFSGSFNIELNTRQMKESPNVKKLLEMYFYSRDAQKRDKNREDIEDPACKYIETLIIPSLSKNDFDREIPDNLTCSVNYVVNEKNYFKITQITAVSGTSKQIKIPFRELLPPENTL